MNALAQRLKDGVATLESLDRTRAMTGNAEFGSDEEYAIVLTELQELEKEILSDSGTRDRVPVPVRRKKRA